MISSGSIRARVFLFTCLSAEGSRHDARWLSTCCLAALVFGLSSPYSHTTQRVIIKLIRCRSSFIAGVVLYTPCTTKALSVPACPQKEAYMMRAVVGYMLSVSSMPFVPSTSARWS